MLKMPSQLLLSIVSLKRGRLEAVPLELTAKTAAN
jgi:hypothetical protein